MIAKISALGYLCDMGGTLLHGAKGNIEIARVVRRFGHYIVSDNRESATERETLALMLRCAGGVEQLQRTEEKEYFAGVNG